MSVDVATQAPAPRADRRAALALDGTGAPRLAAVVVALVALVTYLPALANGFALDDVPIIVQNELVHALRLDLLAAPYWPDGPGLGLYRPLTTFLFAVQWVIGDGSPLVFHTFSMVLHAAASVLAFHLLHALLPAGRERIVAALAGAALFAVHPVHVEAVANVVGQAELTAAVAVLAGCLLHATRPAGAAVAPRRLLAILLLYGVGLAAKEHAVVLPALLLAIDIAQGRLRRRGTLGTTAAADAAVDAPSAASSSYIRATAGLAVGLVLVAGLYLAARALVLGSLLASNANPGFTFLQGDLRIWNALRAWPEYYRLLLFPVDLSVDYAPAVVPVAVGVEPLVLLGALLLAATIAAATQVRRSLVGLAAAWLIVAILPVSNLLFPIGVLIAERTLYLPSFAVSVLAAAAVMHAAPSTGRRRTLVAIGIVAAVLGALAFLRAPVWASTQTVVASLVRDHPESFRAQWTLASRALQAGNVERASQHYDLGRRIYGADPIFLLEYANFRLRQGDLAGALPLLQDARRLDPGQVPARVASAYAFNRTGQPDSALAMYTALRREGSAGGDIQLEIARALDGVGRHAEASTAWLEGAPRTGERAWAFYALAARSAALAGDTAGARTALDAAHAAATDPRAPDILTNVEALIASGCYARGACVGDPLVPWGGTVAED